MAGGFVEASYWQIISFTDIRNAIAFCLLDSDDREPCLPRKVHWRDPSEGMAVCGRSQLTRSIVTVTSNVRVKTTCSSTGSRSADAPVDTIVQTWYETNEGEVDVSVAIEPKSLIKPGEFCSGNTDLFR